MTTGSKLIETQNKQATTTEETEVQTPVSYWLNLGIEVGDFFISLPNGIALDSQEEKLAKLNEKSPAKGETMVQIRALQSVLIKGLMAMASGVPQGEGKQVSEFPNGAKLVIEIRHVGAKGEGKKPLRLSVEDLLKPKAA